MKSHRQEAADNQVEYVEKWLEDAVKSGNRGEARKVAQHLRDSVKLAERVAREERGRR